MLCKSKLNENEFKIDDIVDRLYRYKENLYKSLARRIGISADNECIVNLINGKRFEDPKSLDLKSLCHFYIIEIFYWLPYAIYIIVLFAIGLLIICKIFTRNNDNYDETRMARCNSSLHDRRAIFFTIFEDRVRSEFKTQSAETMSTIVTAVSHILLPNPERPSILLLLSPSNSEDVKNTCSKIARATASAVLSSFQKSSQNIDDATINCSNYCSSDEFWKFYEDVSDRMNRYKVVIMEEFEKLNGQVATAFCHLADDTYAPFPQSIIIACLDIGNRFDLNLDRQEPVTLAETFLEEKWNGTIDGASMTELLGRLTGRTVLIERELPLLRLVTGSLPSIKETRYSGPPSSLRRRRRIARSQNTNVS